MGNPERLPWERYENHGDAETTYTATSPRGSRAEITDTAVAEALSRGGWEVTAVTEGKR